MMNQVILTLTDSNGNSAQIDLYENEKMYLNYKFTDLTDFSAVGSYSREFRIPASKTNVDFFGAIYNVNFNGWFDFRKKVDATLTVNTIPISSGHIQVKKLYWQSGKLFEFELVFFGEVPNLARLLGEKKLGDIQSIVAGDLDYDLLYENVNTPPNQHTILTLCDKWNLTSTNIEGQPIYSAPSGPFMKPLYVGHLTPSVKAQYLFDQILADSGIQYESDYLESALENTFVPFVNGQYLNSAIGLNDIQSTLAFSSNQVSQTVTYGTYEYPFYTHLSEYSDPNSDWSSGIFTAPYSAQFTFKLWFNAIIIDSNGTSHILRFDFFINDVFSPQSIGINTTDNSGNLSYTTTHTLDLNGGDELKIKMHIEPLTPNNEETGGMEFTIIGNGANDYTGTGVQLVSVGTQMINDTVVMQYNAPDMKQIDFIKSIQQMFNLVFVPDKTLPNTLRIEPMVEYLASGNTLDWTQKLDISKDITYYPTTDLQKKNFKFTYAEDSDYFNGIYKANGRTYGEYKISEFDFDVQNDFATGEEKVELAFAATPSNNVEGSDVVVPKFLNESGQFVQPKPRILYYFADFFVMMYNEATGFLEQTAVKCLNNFSTMNATVTDKDLNFGPDIPLHSIVGIPYENLYNRWWRNYYRELYDGQARILEGMFNLTLNDIFTFQFSDKIWVYDSWWRILDIEGYTVGEQEMTKVRLIRLLDIDNDCDLIPVSANLDSLINWETPNGDPATATEDCCRRFGYFWNSEKEGCYSKPNNGTRNLLTVQAPSLAPTKFGAPVTFTQGVTQPVKTITTDYVITNADRVLFADTTSNDINIYLPSATTTKGREFIIQKSSASNNVAVYAYTGETVEGSGSVTFTGLRDTITIISDGNNFTATSSK